MKLLNPGPVTLTARVRQALMGEDLCHRESEFADLQLDVLSRLARVYPEAAAEYVPILLAGSGTAAVEAMLSSFVPKHSVADENQTRALVLINGVYGDRMIKMLKAQDKLYDTVVSAWHDPIDLDEVEKKLRQTAYHGVFVVQHETTTGRLNNIPALGYLCVKYNVPLFLDGVSSFGAEEIQFSEWNVHAVAATANKCLHGSPGVSFVLAKKSLFETPSSHATTLYLDLFQYRKEQIKGYSPFTSPVHTLYAFREALREFDEFGGLQARRHHYQALSAFVEKGLLKLGILPFLKDPLNYSCILKSYIVPSKLTYENLHDTLKLNGFIIYAGQGPYLNQMFRISVMGALEMTDMEKVLNLIKSCLHDG